MSIYKITLKSGAYGYIESYDDMSMPQFIRTKALDENGNRIFLSGEVEGIEKVSSFLEQEK